MTGITESSRVAGQGGPWSVRARAWLLAGSVFALVLIYLGIWATYAATHMEPRYAQLPPGQSATYQSVSYRMLDLLAVEALAATSGDPVPAQPGTLWVVATVEVTAPDPTNYPGCSLDLLGPDGRLWSTGLSAPQRKLPTYCGTDQMQAGIPYTYQAIYAVPQPFVAQLRGLVVKNSLTADPSPVITPPR